MKALSESPILIGLLCLTLSLTGCLEEYESASNDVQAEGATAIDTEPALVIDTDPCDLKCLLNAPEDLTEAEVAMLLQMREEEKLARDVYLTLSESYNLPVFLKISSSEQVHMDRVLCLLIHYQLNDPASTEVGEFTDPYIQELYNGFIDQGEISLLEALDVGASIEDLDIFDLNSLLGLTENSAIISIFENLICGSENHLRSFYDLLAKRGVIYIPEYLTPEEFNPILESDHISCVMD